MSEQVAVVTSSTDHYYGEEMSDKDQKYRTAWTHNFICICIKYIILYTVHVHIRTVQVAIYPHGHHCNADIIYPCDACIWFLPLLAIFVPKMVLTLQLLLVLFSFCQL